MPDRPNLVILMSDHTRSAEMRPGSGCIHPHTDALADQALRLDRCYTVNAICSPSRATLMTGCYPSRHGVWDCTHTQRPGWIDVDQDLDHWSRRLHGAGYAMGYFGKWHVDASNNPGRYGWAEHDIECGHLQMDRIEGSELALSHPGYRDYLLAAVGEEDRQEVNHPAFDKGIDFLQRQEGEQPFCCFISASEPHDPYIPPAGFLDMYDVASTELPETLRAEPTGKPELVARMRSCWTSLTDDDWRTIRACYRAMITFLDQQMQRVIQLLQDRGLWDNTILIITSDHGDMLGTHGLMTKGGGTPYEPVYNIPLLIRLPGARTGADDRHVVSTVDLAATITDLCGVEPLEDNQGRSLRPILTGDSDPADWQSAYAEFYGQRFVYTQRIVWDGDWKFVFSPGGVDELYDLAKDPEETTNLAGRSEHRDRLVEMTKAMWRKMRRIGDESLFGTQYATLRTAAVGPDAID